MDEEAWRAAGAGGQVITQYALGNDTTEAIIGRSPTGIVRLDPDAIPVTLGLLRTVGASSVIVDDEQMPAAMSVQIGYRPFQLVDENGVVIPALRIDSSLHATLDHPDAELGVARAMAELLIAAASSTTDLAVLLDIDIIPPDSLDLLLKGIGIRPEIRVADMDELLELDPARTSAGELRRGQLRPAEGPDVAPLAAELRAATTSIDTLEEMVAPEEGPITPLRDRLLAAVSSDLTVTEARGYAQSVFDDVLAGTSGVEIAPSDRITLTDRRTDLPLTIINSQPLALNVELLLSAEKLRFPDGDRLTLRLEPGENHLDFPVETLASGDARVTATLISPGGFFELGSGTVDIRSTAISGLGLIISIIALLVLGAWWIRTILRIRRNRAAATVSAASDFAEEEGESMSIEGES